ncbi:MAG: protein kinase domain-containing protein [Acidobacteriota bacterium]
MALAVGKRLCSYQIEAPLGAGGMGEVYRARDTKLGRDVAIKVLPEAFTVNPERLARFEREARLLASLNHSNIGSIYGLEESDGQLFLVLELIDGQTLADWIGTAAPRRKAASAGSVWSESEEVQQALTICRQIAEALEAAHERGVIHRDLKPANVKITPDGKVKVLDFGLAKTFVSEEASPDLSASPTVALHSLGEGVILGTAAYMSPEQARGKSLDKRTDIWAFGCVLYETLSGRKPFAGETISDTLAALLREDPDWRALPPETPAKIRDLLRRCLQKDPRQRLHDIADARIEIDEALATFSLPAPEAAPARMPAARSNPAIPWLICLLLTIIAAWAVWNNLREPRQAARRTAWVTLTLPPKTTVALGRGSAVAVSPDGLHVVYSASSGGRTQLYSRSLDRLESTPLGGTDGASNPFFSPDGQWIGFFAGGKLMKVSILGARPVTICDAPVPRGEAWGPDNMIVFSPTGIAGLSRVSSDGGTPQPLTTLNEGELSHRWPQFLPGGKAVLFTIWNDTGFDGGSIAVHILETGERRLLLRGGSFARYVPTMSEPEGLGHLVYARAEGLLAAPFDLKQLKLTGPAVSVIEGLMTNLSGGAHFSLSSEGLLGYLPGVIGEADRTVLWVDRKGDVQTLAQIRGMSRFYRLSPDGRRLARNNTEGPHRDVWIYEIDRGISNRLTFGGDNIVPLWTPDGKRVTFSSGLPTKNLFWKSADGSGSEERLTTSVNTQYAGSWSPDGKTLVYTENDPSTGSDIWILPIEGERKPRPFLRTQFSEGNAALSPDGRWLAYQSNEAGRFDIYVQPFPGGGRKVQVSSDGGTAPLWPRGGGEIFYRSDDKMMAVAVTLQPDFRAEKPRVLFEARLDGALDVSADGRRFVALKPIEQESAPTQLNLVMNWFEELKRRVPAGK